MLKVVTIIFVDVMGSTSRAETMHPEDTRALMTDFFGAMSEEIQHEGGTVERIIGDGIMADFGVPTAHEDDPLRAVRAARAMLRRLERWNVDKDPSHRIEIRVGINTGEVSAAGDPGQDLLVTGDPVNVAARLEQHAEPGTILVGPRTARAIRHEFRLRQLEPLTVKGKSEPIDAFVVDGPLDQTDDHQHRVEPPLVGREVELATLMDAFERCRSTGSPHLVTILGEAGVGKSRLLKEFLGNLSSRATTVIGRCLPYGAGVTLWPLREILESLTGVRDTDPTRTAIGKIETLVKTMGSVVTGDPEETSRALASTIGLRARGGSDVDPRSRHREMLVAWRSLLSDLAARQPLVVVVQDIHWADELMLDVLDDLARHTSGPTLFVCPTRSDVLQSRPTWGVGVGNSMTMKLDPLSEDASSKLIDSLMGDSALPARVKDLVLSRCEGNPFFVQEVLRQLVDQGSVQRHGSPPLDEASFAIPDNVHGVLLARLDLLAPEERAVAQGAAVIGRTFWQGALEHVAQLTDLPRVLRELERRNFIAERTSSSIAGEVEYAFTHALTRDVAYQTIPRPLRGRTHDAVARWIEQTSGDRVDELAELLAHHLDHAHGLSPTEDIRVRARSFNLISCRSALRRFAIRQAETFGRRAIELSHPGPERLESLETFGDISIVAYSIDDAWWAFTEAVTEALSIDELSSAARLCAKAAITATRYEGAMKNLPHDEDVQAIIDLGLQHVGEEDDRSRCLLLASPAFSARVSPPGFVSEATPERAMELAERLNDPELLSVALDAAAFWVAPEARYGEMYRLQTRRVKLVPRLRDVTEACDCLGSACWAAYFAGRYRETIVYADECLQRADGVDAGNYQHALQWRLIARFTLGDWDAALEDQDLLEATVDREADSPIPVFLGSAYSHTLLCHELRGNEAEADAYLALLKQLKAEIGEDMGLPRAPAAVAMLHRGRLEEARDWLTLEDMSMSLGPILEAMCALAPEEGDDEAAAALVKIVRNDVKRMESPSLLGHLERLDGRLLARAGRAEAAVAALESSVASFSDLGAAWEEALSLLHLGEVHLHRDRHQEAERELRRSLDIFTQLGSLTEMDRAAAALAGR